MGLDISVMRPRKVIDVNDDNGYLYILDEDPGLNSFKDFSFDKINQYFDLKGSLEKLGVNINDLEAISIEYGKNTIYSYRNIKHELYEPYLILNKIWSTAYYDTKKELFESKEYEEYLKLLPILKKYGYKPQYKFFASGNEKTYYNLNKAYDFVSKKTLIILKNPVTFDKVDRCIICDEVGYQRKGANTQFYEDDMWNCPIIIDIKTLNEHWEKYFSHRTSESKGGWGSSVEFILENDEMKNRFKENIINKFVEGETFVIYH